MKPILPLLLFALLLTACAPAAAPTPAPAAACPVTQPPKTDFVPPAPWPADPPQESEFWYGDADLWTALPADGTWPNPSYGAKFPWWSQHFDVKEDETPDLLLEAVRIPLQGEKADAISVDNSGHATNMYHESTEWAMLSGLELTPGCWEITGYYRDTNLSLVLFVGDEQP